MGVRLIAGLLAGAMALTAAVVPCAAMMAGQGESAHDCCDHSEPSTPKPQSGCELLCALGNLPATAGDQKALHLDHAAFTAKRPELGTTLGLVSPADRVQVRTPSDHGPPLFVVHGAFLI